MTGPAPGNRSVVPLSLMTPAEESDVGGKAWNLSRLLELDLPVPQGFCIPASSYREHVRASDLNDAVKQALRTISSEAASKAASLATVRQQIISAPLQVGLEAEIASLYAGLPVQRVAVRSSAIGEDSQGHSFAGIHDTILGIEGLAKVLDALRVCWASLWTERAFDYRVRNGFAHENARMAVVVQALVPADVSGVMFTADPVSGSKERLVIEATYGLGEALVSGKVTPDRIVLNKRDLSVLEQVVADKRIECVAGNDGAQECAVDPLRSRSASLPLPQAVELARLALKVESAFAGPQDIEWAIAEDKIYLLQARPITTLPGQRSRDERQIWSNLNTGEVLPGVVSPLTWSLVEGMVRDIFSTMVERIGLSLKNQTIVGLVAGRAYFNLNTFAAVFRSIPGLRGIPLQDIFGGAWGGGGFPLADEDIPRLDFHWGRALLHLPALLFWLVCHHPRAGIRYARKMQSLTIRMERRDYSKLSLAELVGVLLGLVYSFDLQSEAIGFGGTGAICFSQLFAICRKWFDDADGSLANRLLSGMGKLDSAEGGLALWRLAVLVKSDADVERIIQLEHDFAATREELGRIPSGAKFLQAWSSYMEQHGHHCRGEIELKNPRWRETPNAVLNMVRSYVANMGAIDPLALQSRQANQRRQLEDECRRKLTNPVERWLFTKIMLQAQLGCAARENIKSEAVRILGLGRRLLLELGDRLAAKGVIDSRDDVFFLRLEEIEPTVNQRLGTDPRTVIQRRRAEFEKNLQITPPSLVVGTFDASHYTAPTFDPCAKVLTGLGVSPGLVTGAARVILHSDTQEKVLPGEILVAPFTDPGWSPYFIPAAAIVMDQGGLLSHGSIIAREYGIPAVVNVGHATQIIRTGQKIAVDGNRGEVRILE